MGFKLQDSQFSRLIKKYREMKHITQQVLSDASGVEVYRISQYEQGKRDVTISHFCKIMNAIGYDVKVEIRGKGDKTWQKISEAK